uniref:Uncharacterized protein n=1 Tax=Cyprinodon variegatus TaxID=28743 RepID=A0A3Q2GEI6_CYPVA
MVPFTIIYFFQVEMAIQHLNGKEVNFKSLWCLGKAVGFGGAEVKRDGSCLLSVPFVKNNI